VILSLFGVRKDELGQFSDVGEFQGVAFSESRFHGLEDVTHILRRLVAREMLREYHHADHGFRVILDEMARGEIIRNRVVTADQIGDNSPLEIYANRMFLPAFGDEAGWANMHYEGRLVARLLGRAMIGYQDTAGGGRALIYLPDGYLMVFSIFSPLKFI
jgi:hypothetical protein